MGKNYLEMSDDEFLSKNSPDEITQDDSIEEEDAVKASSNSGSEGQPAENIDENPEENQEKTQEENKTQDEQDASADNDSDESDKEAEDQEDVSKAEDKDPDKPEKNQKEGPGAADKSAKNPDGKKDSKAPEAIQEKTETSVNYEEFYKQVMTPFKANGRTISLKTPDEVIRLMQMGAGFGKKLQDLQPHLKVLRMLEKNDLLDEGRLSYLIDINQKNPKAIMKLIKDSGIDPLDLNPEDNVEYIPKNHSVSDKEMAFHQALGDLQAHQTGQETIQIINQTWDQQSKSLLWESPDILGVIQTQRENGIYDQIVAEIDRQKMLGMIPPTTPFLQAYKIAGDYLVAAQGNQVQQDPHQTQNNQLGYQPQVIETRPATPKNTVKNSDKAFAASLTKSTPSKKSTRTTNPLAMADEDFLKQFEGRL